MIDESYFDRFSTAKYRSKNPVQRYLIQRFVERLHGMFVAANPAKRVLEVGVGEGFLSGYLSERFPEKSFTGVDLSRSDLESLARLFPRIETYRLSAYELDTLDQTFDVVICAEVLEHLEDPSRALGQIAALEPKFGIFTVPHEPWFMLSNLARGKNVKRFGNDIEHINHFNKHSFRRLVEPHFEVVDLVGSYPWLLCLARAR